LGAIADGFEPNSAIPGEAAGGRDQLEPFIAISYVSCVLALFHALALYCEYRDELMSVTVI
jgi:hypothetical protein